MKFTPKHFNIFCFIIKCFFSNYIFNLFILHMEAMDLFCVQHTYEYECKKIALFTLYPQYLLSCHFSQNALFLLIPQFL